MQQRSTPTGDARPAATAAEVKPWASDPPPRGVDPAAVFAAGLELHHLANTAYPIAHRRTIWPLRQRAERHRQLLADAFARAPRMSLYAHIPFCERRCSFCEYCVVRRHDEERERAYHRALMQELEGYIELLGGRPPRLAGFDIGGGTPTLVSERRIAELVERVTSAWSLAPTFDISIEATPKIAAERPARIAALRALGIERISIGLQVTGRRLLRRYGRELNSERHNREAVANIRAAGFTRLNIDLMYGLARQRLEDVERAVRYAVALQPEYVTLYRMRYKGTRIRGEAAAVARQRVVETYELAHALLHEAGYAAQPGQNSFSRVPRDPGTSAYLTSRVVWSVPYLGLGLGAQTFTNNLLAYNAGAASKRLDRYLAAVAAGRLPIQDLYRLPPSEGMAKMIAVSFYFGQIHRRAFARRFGVELERRFPAELAFLRRRRLIEDHGDVVRLTASGARVFNGAVALFYFILVRVVNTFLYRLEKRLWIPGFERRGEATR